MLSDGAPGRIRTPDPQIRSLVLYPAELPVLKNEACKIIRRSALWLFGLRGAVCPGQGAYLLRTGGGCKRLFELFLKVTPSCLFARSFPGIRAPTLHKYCLNAALCVG